MVAIMALCYNFVVDGRLATGMKFSILQNLGCFSPAPDPAIYDSLLSLLQGVSTACLTSKAVVASHGFSFGENERAVSSSLSMFIMCIYGLCMMMYSRPFSTSGRVVIKNNGFNPWYPWYSLLAFKITRGGLATRQSKCEWHS